MTTMPRPSRQDLADQEGEEGQQDRRHDPQVTLAEWAPSTGRTETSIKAHWRGLPGFPAPVGRRSRPGVSGPGVPLFSLAALEAWRRSWEATRERPVRQAFEVPGDPNELRTLGAIARLLGVAGSTLTQYREVFDQQATHEDRGRRRYYRVGDVVEILNARQGVGVARDPEGDQRRSAPRDL